MGSLTLKRLTCFSYISLDAWTVGGSLFTHRSGGECKRERREHVETDGVSWCWNAQSWIVFSWTEQLNCDWFLHVMRLHVINVVVEFSLKKIKRDVSQLFTNRQVNFTTEKGTKTFLLWCVTKWDFFNETEVGSCFLKKSDIFFSSAKTCQAW